MIEKHFDYRVRCDTHLGSAYINQTFPIYPFSQYPTGNEMGVSLFSRNIESSRQLQMATALMWLSKEHTKKTIKRKRGTRKKNFLEKTPKKETKAKREKQRKKKKEKEKVDLWRLYDIRL